MNFVVSDRVQLKDDDSRTWIVREQNTDGTLVIEEHNPITFDELEEYRKDGRDLKDFEPEVMQVTPTELELVQSHAENIRRREEESAFWERADRETALTEMLTTVKALLSDPHTRRDGIYRLAQYLLKVYHILTLETGEIHVYNEGVYAPDGAMLLSSYLQRDLQLGSLLTTHYVTECLNYVKRLTHKKLADVPDEKTALCLANGILNLDTLQIEPHTPQRIFFTKSPVTYLENATCPRITQFLSEIVTPEHILVLQELAGYTLLKGYPIHKAIMLVGAGANGKSTLLNVFRAFLGPQNCSAIPLQQLENNRFAASALFGKAANIFADLPARALRETAMFKLLTGEDLIPAEKKFVAHFFFVNTAKLIFSCNQIPRSPDDSDAFFRRWIIIVFPHQFLGDNADKKLLDELTTEEELSGFLNFSIVGLRRLLDNGDFTHTQSIDEIREDYIRKSDSVQAFTLDCIAVAPEQFVQKKVLYTHYCDYCRTHEYPVVTENEFHKRLQARIRVEDYRPQIDGRRVQCWRGITYNQELVNTPDNPDITDTVTPVKDVKAKTHLSLKADIVAFIREQPGLVARETLVHQFPNQNTEQTITELLMTGDLYEPKHRFLEALQRRNKQETDF